MGVHNQLQLTGQIKTQPQVRFSPTGIGHAEFIFEHQSTQYEGLLQRQAYCNIRTVVSGDLFKKFVEQLVIQAPFALSGFLSLRSLKDNPEMVFYVQHIELMKE